jgi:hypothetical protein
MGTSWQRRLRPNSPTKSIANNLVMAAILGPLFKLHYSIEFSLADNLYRDKKLMARTQLEIDNQVSIISNTLDVRNSLPI